MSLLLGLDPDDPAVEERDLDHLVEHLLADLELAPGLVLTHVVRGDGAPRAVASVELAGPATGGLGEAVLAAWPGGVVLEGEPGEPALERGTDAARDAARAAVRRARSRADARAVRFPGQEALTGPLPVADVPLVCAVEQVVPVVGEAAPDTVLDPQGHVRPVLRDGRLVLLVRPGSGGTVVPYEKREEHACAGH